MELLSNSLKVLLFLNTVFGSKRGQLNKNARENEIIEKTYITLRYPFNALQIQSAVAKNVISARRRRLFNSVEPVFENCRSTNFTQPYTQLKRQVKCKPRDTVVNLIAQPGTIMTPNAVVVKRCGGMCNGYKRCLSKKTRDAKFYIRTIQRQETYCNSVTVPEDTECKCACEQTKNDCLEMQVYDQRTCSCKCINNDEQVQCAERANFRWDDSTCTCSCLYEKTCTTGTMWLPDECRCAKIF